MAGRLKPTDADELREAVAWAVAEAKTLEVVAGGSKRAMGRPAQAALTLDVGALAGITLYEPRELVLSARVGTPLSQIEKALAEHGQELAFEPADYGPLLGGRPGRATIGGVIAANLSGPRRIKAGAARDHFLGVQAVSGRGEAFKAGGRVVKNVTGYDLCKGLAGSWGTLAVMSEVTLKVLPAAENERSILVSGLDEEAAAGAMSAAMGSSCEVSGAAHLPEPAARRSKVQPVAGAGRAVAVLRVEGFGPSVAYRVRKLKELLAPFAAEGAGEIGEIDGEASKALWREIRDVRLLAGGPDRCLWRLSVPPMAGAGVLRRVGEAVDMEAFQDWAGGLVWVELAGTHDDGGAQLIRGAIGACGGHATLVRAPARLRAAIPVFQPQEPVLAALSARLKAGFDPKGILNPGRMAAGT